jgi:hypothetical protein
MTIDGTEGPIGHFNCPHGIWIDPRGPQQELYIADRSNHCVQVYDLSGKFKYSFGEGIVYSPCSFVAYKDQLIIPEIHCRVTILDAHKKLVCYLGENIPACERPGWPNLPKSQIEPGKFISPHAAAVDSEGNIYVAEWIIGGRITKLVKYG